MNESLGKRLADLRREKNWTQDVVAEQLDVSPQAVSKWENDISCPDILLLPRIADLFGITLDELFGRKEAETRLVPEEERLPADKLLLKIRVNSSDGDKVNINLPIPLVKAALELGMKLPQVSGNDALQNIDFNQILLMVDNGLIGKLVEVESADGDTVSIWWNSRHIVFSFMVCCSHGLLYLIASYGKSLGWSRPHNSGEYLFRR